jgi:hypothetical protein
LHSHSENEALPWSVELIERFLDEWDWNSLSRNEGLPWSLELIEHFKDRWHWTNFANNARLCLPMLSPADIVEVMAHHPRPVGRRPFRPRG